MSVKRALVVDDSRSARAFLTRILERYELQVDSAGSAEEAIEYLNRQRPDVIFMDHLMPGMDGFQALAVIKNDPRTATIPIMMYTSQEGELYLSQARALGAIGVLPKQTKPADVSRALEQLHLLGERRPEAEAAIARMPPLQETAVINEAGNPAGERPGPVVTGVAAARARSQAPAAPTLSSAELASLSPEVRTLIEAMLRDHALEMRRFVSQSLEKHAERIVGDVRSLLGEQPLAAPPSPAAAGPAAATLWLSAAAAIIAVVAGVLWMRGRQDVSAPAAASLPSAVPAASTADIARTMSLPAPATPGAAEIPGQANSTAPVAAGFVDSVPFGELPLAGPRIEHVQGVLDRLVAGGFRGHVEIRSFPGRFCMQGNGDTASLPSGETAYAKCEQLGNPQDLAEPAARETVGFANMLAEVRRRSNGAFVVQVGVGTVDEAVVPYPAIAPALTAGEWNRAAAANNRVEVRWRAQP